MLSRLKYDLTMAEAARGPGGSRVDLLVVAAMVEHGARVLDVGCGDGELLRLLETSGVDGRGIELSREGVNECVAKGLAVVQGDADTDLANYPNDAFDYVILSQTLQATRQPRVVLEHMLQLAATPSCRFRISVTGTSGCSFCSAATCRAPTICLRLAGDAEYPLLQHQGFSRSLSRRRRQNGRGRGAQCLGPADAAENAVVVLEFVRRAGRLFR